MSAQLIGALAMAGLLGLLTLGCPVGTAMLLAGVLGAAAIAGWGPALAVLETGAMDTATNYSFTLLPLFLLMGALVTRAGMSRDLFLAARRLTGGWNGGLAMAAVTACAAFATVSGSSIATASTMTRVAYPQMRAQGYDPRLACGALAAGGTLGIMIPPSIALLLYALMTEQSVSTMFLAGLVPGLVGFVLYVVCVCIMARVWPPSLPEGLGDAGSLGLALRRLGPTLALFGLVMGGLYGGVFTPTEAGGAGAGLALVFALARGCGWRDVVGALIETAQITASIFVILIGAEVFGYLIALSKISNAMAAGIAAAGWTPWQLMGAIVLFYLVAGVYLESLAMILLTVPLFHPLVIAAGFDPVWFGVIAVVTVEIGLISPPVGMNLFVVKAGAEGASMRQVMLGVLPFVLTDLVRLGLLLAFPALSLWLPHLWV